MKKSQNQVSAGPVPFYAWTADELAALFGVSPSRIDGYADAGKLPRLDNDRYDFAWLLNLAVGQAETAGRTAGFPPPSARTLVMIGLMAGLCWKPDKEDVTAAIALFERNGFDICDFTTALIETFPYRKPSKASRLN